MSVKYAITGDDITVTAGGASHRAYNISINRGANQVSARAFEDAPDEEAIVLVTQFTDITVNFRDDVSAVFELGDEVAIVTTFDNVSKTYQAKVVSSVKTGSVDGIADFSVNFRVLPAVSGS